MKVEEIFRNFFCWGISINEHQAHLIQTYYKILIAENKKYNLTRILEPQAFLEEHFFDSLAWLVDGIKERNNALLDLGSGAGFPGIPIKIFLPDIKLVLVEASVKKISFLELLVKELKLKDTILLQQRAEVMGRGREREKFPWVTARGVAPLPVLLEIALPMVKTGGYFWAFKGPMYHRELAVAEEILTLCGGQLVKKIDYRLPATKKDRIILIFKKQEKTDERFPRRAGIPQKRPWKNKEQENNGS